MLLLWKNRLGKQECIINLVDALRGIRYGYYDIEIT